MIGRSRHGQDLCASRSVRRINLQKSLDHILEILRVTCGDRWILTFDDFVVETLHICSSKRWIQSAQLIEDTTHAPNIALIVIRLILPHFRTCIVRGPSLGMEKASLSNF